MPQSLAKNLIHLVFSTKRRATILPHETFEPLQKYASGILDEQKCRLSEMNNGADHVHLLFDLHRTKALADVVMHLKKGTSRWLKEESPRFSGFEWQDDYGAFSLGQSQKDAAVAYIRNQQAHHATVSFQDELRILLRSYEVEFDERYIWD